ncbi:MAG: hypothetical protein KJO41_09235 [Bacteroidia bacterium]|nr:hypothetical protein [Bacteroidia bacterium]NNK60862.1 hypothetical protein [Flavobacteriaceae bacterium]NNL33847.1 hypothetical protein [Flavobacteriaceae bacterium]NNM35666.1 hypothetical protein [Nitrosopumilus sp.]
MKTTNQLFSVIVVMLLLITPSIFAQDQARPEYITVMTMHWNMDNDDFDMDEWIATEKEYLEKVTKKNELIIGSSFYLHLYSEDNTELIFVQSFANWEDIDKAGDRNAELSREAWPDSTARRAYFQKRNDYYSVHHSDEIYATMSGAKPVPTANTQDLICYVRRSHFAYPEDGTGKEFNMLRNQVLENVIHKNEYIKAYYPNAHGWGADRTEYLEAFFVESMADLEKMNARNGELFNEFMPNEEDRKAFGEKNGKYYTGIHSDSIYTYIAELAKN